MQILEYPFSSPTTDTVVALGCFDGTHAGHEALFARTVKEALRLHATPAVFTFSDFLPHKGRVLSTLEERLRRMEEGGIAAVYLCPFERVRHLSPEEFIHHVLRAQLGAVSTVCGFNYRFGEGARGDGDTLRAHFPSAVQVEAVTYDGLPVSSSRIRTAVAEGRVEEAAAMLGRPYTVSGTVTHGKSVGRAFGFPTANIAVTTLLPAYGVYETRITVDGRAYRALSDVGVRPTLEGEGEERVESFLLDFTGDLYGKTMQVSFLRRLREERRFADAESLWAQIQKDVDSIKNERS